MTILKRSKKVKFKGLKMLLKFTFALPEGCTDVTVGFRFAGDGTELAFTAKDDRS